MAGRDRFHHASTDATSAADADTTAAGDTAASTTDAAETVVSGADADPVARAENDAVGAQSVHTGVSSADADAVESSADAAGTAPEDIPATTADAGTATTVAGTDVAVRAARATDVATRYTVGADIVHFVCTPDAADDMAGADTAAGSTTFADMATVGAARGLEIYADSAYGTGEARAAYLAAGHDVVIKPKPLTPAVAGGFTLNDFVVDEAAGTVTCPNGNTRPMSQARTVTFGQLCRPCPLRERCTTSKTGRSMTIHEHEGLLRAARAQATTAQYKQDYPTRSNVERTVAHVATQNGRRVKLCYIGTTKNNAWLRTRCASLNLRTLLRHGLTRQNGAWAVA